MRPLWLFLVKNYFVFLFVLLEGIALALFINHTYYQRAIVVSTTNDLSGFFFEMRDDISQYFSLKAENNRLREENALLRTRKERSFIGTDNKVFEYKDSLFRLRYTYLAAEVLNNSTGKSANFLTLNKGSRHGIKKEMAVISSDGVVGVVHEVSPNFCSVISLLHPDTRISAKLKRLDYIGTVVWKGGTASVANLTDVPIHVKLKVGDTVVTSGYSLIFPEGIPVGIVSKFKVGTGNDFYDIDILLSTNFNNLRSVYIINNLLKEELEGLENKSHKK